MLIILQLVNLFFPFIFFSDVPIPLCIMKSRMGKPRLTVNTFTLSFIQTKCFLTQESQNITDPILFQPEDSALNRPDAAPIRPTSHGIGQPESRDVGQCTININMCI